MMPAEKGRSLFLNDSSSPQALSSESRSAKSMVKGPDLGELERGSKDRQEKTAEAANSQEKLKLTSSAGPDFFVEEDIKAKEEPVPDAYKDLEPWLFQEFGDIVEIVD